ncbi:MAG: DUF4271 domain-containing protein [Bacteroidaceae bacterium]|jgi:hypothetical protein
MNGTPLPYLPVSDSWIMLLTLLFLLVSCHILAYDHASLGAEIKKVFVPHHDNQGIPQATASEMRHFLFLQVQTAILAALLFVCYAWGIRPRPGTFYQNLLHFSIFAAIVFACCTMRTLLYMLIGWIFFRKEQAASWMRCYFTTENIFSFCLLIIVLLCIYADIEPQKCVIAGLIVLFLLKSLLFFKGIHLFSLSPISRLYFILYLCALEIIPIIFAVSGLYAANNTSSLNI